MADLWETLKERPTGKALRLLVEALVLRSLKESLRGVYLRGEAPEGPLVLALNHHGFFDGHLAWLLGKLCRRPLSLLVAEENLRAYPVLKLAGALEAGRVREALRRLRRGEWVALFPEGERVAVRPTREAEGRVEVHWVEGGAGLEERRRFEADLLARRLLALKAEGYADRKSTRLNSSHRL